MTTLPAASRSSQGDFTRAVLKCHMRPKGPMMLTLPVYGMSFQDASADEAGMDGTPQGLS